MHCIHTYWIFRRKSKASSHRARHRYRTTVRTKSVCYMVWYILYIYYIASLSQHIKHIICISFSCDAVCHSVVYSVTQVMSWNARTQRLCRWFMCEWVRYIYTIASSSEYSIRFCRSLAAMTTTTTTTSSDYVCFLIRFAPCTWSASTPAAWLICSGWAATHASLTQNHTRAPPTTHNILPFNKI